MARMLRDRPTASNPRFIADNAEKLAAGAAGLAGAGWVNDSFLAPIAKNIGGGGSPTVSKAIDAFTTLVAAYGLGYVTRMVAPKYSFDVQFGGSILGAGKLIAALVPGFSISSQVPFGGTSSTAAAAGAAAGAALPSGSTGASGSMAALPPGGASNGAVAASAAPVASATATRYPPFTGYVRPVQPNFQVGL